MNKKILLNFIQDKFCLSIFFFINTFLITLFFHLALGNSIDVIYPVTISIFIYIILIAVELIRYYKFNSNLHKCIDNLNYDLEPSTFEQKEVSNLVNNLHNIYGNKIATIIASNKSQRHFLSQWIHNMKTPVSVIDLILQNTDLKYQSDFTGFEGIFENIRDENKRLSNNLDQALSFIRIDDFSKDYVPETVDLLTSVKKVINNKKTQFIYSNVYPKLVCEKEKIFVLSDSKWNEVLIEQIVSNAIKYSKNEVKSKNVFFIIKQNENITTLEIKDEGLGIPESDIGRIFEPFFTGENGRVIQNATGIGLYICSVISDKLQHSINVTSEVGIGTSFQITYLSKM